MSLVICGFAAEIRAAPDYMRIPQDPTHGGFQARPDVRRLADGRLVCLFYNGYTHVSPKNARFPDSGRIDYSISTDEGYTWRTPALFYDSSADDYDASTTLLTDGQLAVTFFKDYYSNGQPNGSSGAMYMTCLLTSGPSLFVYVSCPTCMRFVYVFNR